MSDLFVERTRTRECTWRCVANKLPLTLNSHTYIRRVNINCCYLSYDLRRAIVFAKFIINNFRRISERREIPDSIEKPQNIAR